MSYCLCAARGVAVHQAAGQRQLDRCVHLPLSKPRVPYPGS